MIKFTAKLITCAILVVVALFCICTGVYLLTAGMFTKDSYQKGFVYQLRALERFKSEHPKVLILGGSYMTFAMDMPLFRKMMDMPAFELGVHSGMGQAYTFEQAERFIAKDDVVVFLFAGFSKDDFGMPLIYNTLDGEGDLMIDFIVKHPLVVFNSICSECSHRILKLISEYTRNAIARKLTGKSFGSSGAYCAKAFDPNTGDMIYNRTCEDKRGQEKARFKFDDRSISDSCFEVINDLYRCCESRGASMVIAFPPFVVDSILPGRSDAAVLDNYQERLQSRLLPKIIAKQKDTIYQVEMIHNCAMHLNSCGAKCFTEKLAENLKRYLSEMR